ncbi:hypothetical protein ACVWWG_009516 [Bradyrhizobium sp. LB7.2]
MVMRWPVTNQGPNGVGANAVTDTARQLGVTKPIQAGPHGALSSRKNTLFASYLAAARQLREPTINGVPSLVRTMTSFAYGAWRKSQRRKNDRT